MSHNPEEVPWWDSVSADELSAGVKGALSELDPAKLSKLGRIYLDQAQERLSDLTDVEVRS